MYLFCIFYQSVCLVCADNESDEDKYEDQENITYCNSGQLSNGVKHQANHVLPSEYKQPFSSTFTSSHTC